MVDRSLGNGKYEVQASGIQIAYRRSGDGPPLVLLHGGVEDCRSWTRQISGLSDEFTVLAWDAPGCGDSSDIPETWRLPDYASALASWLNALGVVKPHVLGLSWGSSVALEFYRLHPDSPASLILASAYAGWAGSLPSEEVARRLTGVLATADASEAEPLSAFPGLFSPAATPEIIEEVRQIAAANSAASHPGGYRAMAHSMAEADLRSVLPGLGIPTLLLYGELDERSPVHVARSLQSQIRGAELVLIPGVGHLANLESPDAFNQHVREFIRRVGRST
jgi:pimeloyl-ACP methyl ester carboxylesterase